MTVEKQIIVGSTIGCLLALAAVVAAAWVVKLFGG